MDSNKRKHDICLKKSNNKASKLKTKEVKKSPSKNNAHSKDVTSSSPKQKLQKEKKGSSKGDLDMSDKHDKISKQLNFNNLNNSISISASEDDNDIKSPSRKKAKMDIFDERIEKKKQRAMMYEKYLQRGGARNPGSKEIPIVRNFIVIVVNSERNTEIVVRRFSINSQFSGC